MTAPILLTVDTRGVATLTLNREECHNAIDHNCANLLTAHLETLAEDPDIRLIILTGKGISFSAGHDIEAMRRMAAASHESLVREIREYATLLSTLDTLGTPTIARVQGSAFGFGVGMIACCDFAIGCTDALFGFSEVRLGIMASISAPYILRAIGARDTRRYLIGSERFNAGKAKRLGLLHQDVPRQALDVTVEQLIRQLLINGPRAMHESKCLVRELVNRKIAPDLIDEMIERTARIYESPEGREGLGAFIEHRTPGWVK
jgi:methylglutaconyl-CoA hydratase